MNRLSEILQKLDKVASDSGVEGASDLGSESTPKIGRLEELVKSLEEKSVKSGNRHIEAFDVYVKEKVEPFVKLCDEVGVTEFSTLGDLGERAMNTMEHIKRSIVFASKHKKPSSQEEVVKIFYYITKDQKAWDDIRFESKGLDEYNHYSACWEAFKMAKWVFVRDAPFGFVKNCVEQTDFFAMKVLQKFRRKDPAHHEWTKALKIVILGLHDYVKEYHMTGLKWNPKGN